MGRHKVKEKKAVVSFSIPAEALKDFDLIRNEVNKRNNADFSRSDLLNILILEYNVKMGTDILKEINKIKEEN